MRQHQDIHTGRAQVRSQRHRSARPPHSSPVGWVTPQGVSSQPAASTGPRPHPPRRTPSRCCSARGPARSVGGAWMWVLRQDIEREHRPDDAQTVRRRFTSALNGYADERQSRSRPSWPAPWPARPARVRPGSREGWCGRARTAPAAAARPRRTARALPGPGSCALVSASRALNRRRGPFVTVGTTSG